MGVRHNLGEDVPVEGTSESLRWGAEGSLYRLGGSSRRGKMKGNYEELRGVGIGRSTNRRGEWEILLVVADLETVIRRV